MILDIATDTIDLPDEVKYPSRYPNHPKVDIESFEEYYKFKVIAPKKNAYDKGVRKGYISFREAVDCFGGTSNFLFSLNSHFKKSLDTRITNDGMRRYAGSMILIRLST